ATMTKEGSGAITTEMLLHASKSTVAKGESNDQFLKRVTHLTLSNKKLTAIGGTVLDSCKNVKVLYLYDNKITAIDGLASLRNLTQLHLQRNRITKMDNLDPLVHLEKLYLDGNHITCLEGLRHCTLLQELHLANQTPTDRATEFSWETSSLHAIAPTLRLLDVSNCNVHSTAALTCLGHLDTLDLSRNHIREMEDVYGLVGALRSLRELNLTNNHVNATPKYREHTVIFSHATLETLDKKPIESKQRAMMQKHVAYKHKKRLEKGAPQESEQSAKDTTSWGLVSGNNNWHSE
ncbi:hypothetical protein As57867_023576, partial [Aphanomyces stellatus]